MSPRQTVADDFARTIRQVHDPHSMDAWSERIEAQTWEKLAARVDREFARMEQAVSGLKWSRIDPTENRITVGNQRECRACGAVSVAPSGAVQDTLEHITSPRGWAFTERAKT